MRKQLTDLESLLVEHILVEGSPVECLLGGDQVLLQLGQLVLTLLNHTLAAKGERERVHQCNDNKNSVVVK